MTLQNALSKAFLNPFRFFFLAVAVSSIGSAIPAKAQQIPALLEVPATIVAAQPSLVAQRAALAQERNDLRGKFASQKAQCSAVDERDTAKVASCTKTAQTLSAALERHIKSSEAYNSLLGKIVSLRGAATIEVKAHIEGLVNPEKPSWDCYCWRRWIIRNGHPSLEIIRTPEQQAAHEALKNMDELSAALTRARDKYFSTDDPSTTVLKEAAKEMIKEAAKHLLLQEAAAVEDFEKAINTIEALHKFLEGKEAWDLFHEQREAQNELNKIVQDSSKALEGWRTANARAKNVPSLEATLSEPFTMTFTNRAGERVAIVTRSTDGITKEITIQ